MPLVRIIIANSMAKDRQIRYPKLLLITCQ